MSGVNRSIHDTGFFVTGGTLRQDASCYVEREADRDLTKGLLEADFCYVLTSRQMGKSSLMVRTAGRLKELGISVVVLDLTAIGLNLTAEQWYDGLVVRMANQLRLEDELEAFWAENTRLGPLQRMMACLQEVIVPRLSSRLGVGKGTRLVIFVDEIDTVRSLPFSTDEFFAAIRECYNRRAIDPEFGGLTFCLLGMAMPADLIRDPKMTPFNIGRRIELTDFSEREIDPLATGLESRLTVGARERTNTGRMMRRVLHWTGGHPYLTQRLCRAVVEVELALHSSLTPEQLIDRLSEDLFLSARARERDDNLLFVRERLLRTERDLAALLQVYERIWVGESVLDEEGDSLKDELLLCGIVRACEGRLTVRNRIYEAVFDVAWIKANKPDAELEKPGGERVSLQATCSMGRAPGNDIVLAGDKVSRRHAQIQRQQGNEFWLVDLGSSNGTFLNGRRVSQAVLLTDQDQVEIGQFRLVFRQSSRPRRAVAGEAGSEKTIVDFKMERH